MRCSSSIARANGSNCWIRTSASRCSPRSGYARSGSATRWDCASANAQMVDELVARLAAVGRSGAARRGIPAEGRSAHDPASVRRRERGARGIAQAATPVGQWRAPHTAKPRLPPLVSGTTTRKRCLGPRKRCGWIDETTTSWPWSDDLHNLAAIYSSGGDHEQARLCLEEALQLCQPVVTGAEPEYGDAVVERLIHVLHMLRPAADRTGRARSRARVSDASRQSGHGNG